ncbi:MAG: hypothetical protein RL497_2752 [Pseudomonadota bacterium]|jgi:secreted PhoX family phosphatase
MKGTQHPSNNITLNPSQEPSITTLVAGICASRREVLLGAFGGLTACSSLGEIHTQSVPAYSGFAGIGFHSIPADTLPVDDRVQLPPGYTLAPLVCWGDPIMPGAPDWLEDASQNASAQEQQFGMHNDGMHFFPLPGAVDRGILCVNNEYTHEEILHGAEGLSGGAGVTLAKVRKSQAAQGVSVLEISKTAGRWGVVRDSRYGRRITANTPLQFAGPAAGHPLLRSLSYQIKADSTVKIGQGDGLSGHGTFSNCANGHTPWGTYLTCEENWNGNFGWDSIRPPSLGDAQKDALLMKGFARYGVKPKGAGSQWHQRDERFNLSANPLEAHHFGWVVEIDPFDPQSRPIKRTALGRFKHENARLALSQDARLDMRLAYYMGDDERNEYIYKFVASKPYTPANPAANRHLLDDGVLYVARFSDQPVAGKTQVYRGEWLALLPDAVTLLDDPANPGKKLRLKDLPSFKAANDAEVLALILINTRMAADALGATMMDRPEWMALRTYVKDNANTNASKQSSQALPLYSAQFPLEIYCTLTNNDRRGDATKASINKPDGSTEAGTAQPPVDRANPRPDNDFGHIIRWREDNNQVTALGFEWDIFLLAGDANTTKTLAANYLNTNLVGAQPAAGPYYQGQISDRSPKNPASFGAPDGLWFDDFGRLWIQTDQAGNASDDWVNIGTNVLCCADPATKEVRRFMTSPRDCEVTGITASPDGTTFFVGIQHPGEDAKAANPTEFSNWPQGQFSHNSAGQPLPNGPKRRPRSSVLVITRTDGKIIGGV